MAFKRTMDTARLTHTQAVLYDEVERLLAVLRIRSNRDMLPDHQFYLAGSLLERWRWNASVIGDTDLREFLATVQELVKEIEAANRAQTQRDG